MKREAVTIAHVFSWEALFMALDERFKFGLTRTELALLAPFAAAAFGLAVKYGRPIASILYRRLLIAVGAAVLVLGVSSAEASTSRMVLIAGEERTVLEEMPDGVVLERTEARDVLYLDWSIALDVILIDMRRPRAYTAGAVPGVGWGLRWCPEFWTLSDAFLGLDLVVSAGLEIPDGSPVGASFSGLLALTIGNLGSIGGGLRARIGFGDFPDDVVPTLAIGVRYSP